MNMREFEYLKEDWAEEKSLDEKLKIINKIDDEKYKSPPSSFDAKRTLAWIWKSIPYTDDILGKNCRDSDGVFNIKSRDYFFKLRRKAIYRYLIQCVSDDLNSKYYFATRILKGKSERANEVLDPEKEVDFLIKDEGELDFFFFDSCDIDKNKMDNSGQLHIRFLTIWFTRRYDLSTAWWLNRMMWQHLPQCTFLKTVSKITPPLVRQVSNNFLLLITFLAIFTPLLLYLYGYFQLGFAWDVFHHSSISSMCYQAPLVVAYTVAVLSPVLILNEQVYQLMQLLIPRLAACIVVGYVPLVITDGAWETVTLLSPLSVTCVFVLSLIGSFVYLLIEMRNRIRQPGIAWGRSAKVVMIGIGWSWIIGLLLMDLLGNVFKCRLPRLNTMLWVPGLFGEIPVLVLLLYMPLALLLGIFLQIIWEEKPITEPL